MNCIQLPHYLVLLVPLFDLHQWLCLGDITFRLLCLQSVFRDVELFFFHSQLSFTYNRLLTDDQFIGVTFVSFEPACLSQSFGRHEMALVIHGKAATAQPVGQRL